MSNKALIAFADEVLRHNPGVIGIPKRLIMEEGVKFNDGYEVEKDPGLSRCPMTFGGKYEVEEFEPQRFIDKSYAKSEFLVLSITVWIG